MGIIRKIKAGFLAAIISLTGVLSALPAEAIEEDWSYKTYDANMLKIFSERTKEDVAEAYSKAIYPESTYNNNDTNSWYSEIPSKEKPYNPGAITADTHQAMVDMINYYRWQMGCDPVTGDMSGAEVLQKGALVRNFDFNHTVRDSFKPVDMPDELWQEGVECIHNVLATGYTPQNAVFGWMNEGYNLLTGSDTHIGHRAVTMLMSLSKISFGYCGSVAIGNCIEHKNPENMPFAAYPSPGYMPLQLVDAPFCAWTLEFNGDWFSAEDIDTVTVDIQNIETGQRWTRSAADETLRMSQFGCLVFVQPDDYNENNRYTGSYQVTLRGLWDERYDVEAALTYRVDFFDLDQYAEARVVAASACREYMLAPEMMTDDGLSAVASILPDTIEVITDKEQQTFDVEVDGEWQIDKENKCFVNSIDISKLPSRISDPKGYLDRITISYTEKTNPDTLLYDTLDIIPNKINAGGKVVIEAYRTVYALKQVEIFRLYDDGSGGYKSEEVFDAIDAAANTDLSTTGYTIECVSPEDSGKYISVYYSQQWLDDRYITPIYVSNAISTLTVEDVKYDIDGNGLINLTDLTVMIKVMHGLAPCPVSADCDGNGAVNIFDLILAREYILSKFA